MTFTDAYLAYKFDFFCKEGTYDNSMEYYEFLDKLAYSLIHNDDGRPVRRPKWPLEVDLEEINQVRQYFIFSLISSMTIFPLY
jgi:hypothetical protein